jgi:hypothetical protein
MRTLSPARTTCLDRGGSWLPARAETSQDTQPTLADVCKQPTQKHTHNSYYLLMQPRAHAHAARTRSGPANNTVCERASKRDEKHISCTWLYTAYRHAAVERWKPERHRQETACKCCEKIRDKRRTATACLVRVVPQKTLYGDVRREVSGISAPGSWPVV